MSTNIVSDDMLKAFINASLHRRSPTLTLIRNPEIEGDDHMVYFINEEPGYVLRVTKPRLNRGYDGQEMHTRDVALRRMMRDEYQARGLAHTHIPVSVASQLLSQDGTHAASLETRLYGVSLDYGPVTPATVKGLMEFLSILKATEVADLEQRLGVRVPSIPFPDLHDIWEKAKGAWTRLVQKGQISRKEYGENIDDLFAQKTTSMADIQSDQTRQVLIHNDIKGEHILVDAESGQITGILDWADAGVGNPAVDIAGLVLTVGTSLATELAQEVGYSSSEIMQGVMQARCECVLRLDDRLNGMDRLSPVELLQNQLMVSLRDG